MRRRATFLNTDLEEWGTIRYAIDHEGKKLGFIVAGSRSKRRRKSRVKESPDQNMRSMIAKNLHKIEKKIKSRILRTENGFISMSLGEGHWGVAYRLTNGNVLKITRDPTEGGSALFWKESQRKNPKLLSGTTKIFNVFGVKKRTTKYFFIEREYVDVPNYCPIPIRQYLNKFVDEFNNFCSINNKYSYIYLERARIAIEQLKKTTPGLALVLQYGWDKGVPLIDATENNIGIRVRKSKKYEDAKAGTWVVFDFGGLSQKCFDRVSKSSKGKKTSIKGILKKYCSKVPMLK